MLVSITREVARCNLLSKFHRSLKNQSAAVRQSRATSLWTPIVGS